MRTPKNSRKAEKEVAEYIERRRESKGCSSRLATLMRVFKLGTQAEKPGRRINGYPLIAQVLEGAEFVDGELKKAA